MTPRSDPQDAAEAVRIYAPATVANLGPGYDVLGLALDAPGDVVTARRRPGEPDAALMRVTGAGALPPATNANTAAVAARLVLEQTGLDTGVELELDKGLPIGSGLGSSGASAVAAAVAVNELCGARLPVSALLAICTRAEAAACGAAHPDNVAPALYGGVTLVRALDDVVRVALHPSLTLAVAMVSPAQALATRDARAAIPAQVPLSEAVHNAAHLAALIHGLVTGDLALIGRSLCDRIAEPRRAPLIPGLAEVKAAAAEAGALGASISGAGPAMFALCADLAAARGAAQAMSRALDAIGVAHRRWVGQVARRGARPLSPGAPPPHVEEI